MSSDAYLRYSLNETVVGIDALMRASQSLKARIFRYPQCNSIFGAASLQFSYNAVSDIRYALSIQTIHHGLNDVEFVKN